MSNPEEQAQQAAQEAQQVATDQAAQQQQTPEQQQKDQQATQKIEKSIDDNSADKQYKENLRTLQRIVAQASPIVENKDGAKVTTGYNYYAVDGEPIETWVEKTFGGNVTLDKEKREIKVNDETKKAKK